MFLLLNGGLGIRGPPGFHAAVTAAGGDDARGAALVVIGILGVTAFGATIVAPFISLGLTGPAIAATAFALLALASTALPAREFAPAGD